MKQILSLAAVAAVAFALSIVFRSDAPSPTQSLDHDIAISTTSAITTSNIDNSPTAPTPAYSSEQGRLQQKPTEQIAPRTPAEHTVHMTIVAPDGTSEFEVDLRDGEDLCENIEEAKSEGHIRSLTMDNSYLETFGSRYVREINGYSNNWTVEVNGVGPKGCSLYEPKAGDTIIWTFGV